MAARLTARLRRLWERSKAWPWPIQILVALLALAPVGGVLNTLDHEPADGDAVEARPVLSAPETSTTTPAAPTSTTTTTVVSLSTAPDTTSPQVTTPLVTTTTAPPEPVDLVARLRIEPEHPRTGYDRDLFNHWIGDPCDTRCRVLQRDRVATLPGLPDGGWVSLYDGYSTDNPDELEIDHVVALAEAWDSGADTWDPARREAFANDLEHPGALRAVTAATNRSKGDRDPAEWQPPNRDAWCAYATDWITTKLDWDLAADHAEASALRNMLRGC
jgi:hypothetical protein